MRYVTVNIFGIFVAPFAPMMLVAWLLTSPLLRLGDFLGVTRYVWHPSLFNGAVYVIVLSAVVIIAGWL
jgi:hypothetical protein